ncbi:MAG: DUF1460 domain-containing protein [Myxococcales bacterium]|nr:DUF1460 domain-containing protein [Myxococcales bacterium]
MLALAWVAVGLAAEPSPALPGVGAAPEELRAVAAEVRDQPLAERVGAISAVLLGRPYVNDPMGEGAGHDADPLARYDQFDCLTFAEEVYSFALAADPVDAARIRDAMRYGPGPLDYAHRRHFMELQWIPGNVADGWLRLTTTEYGDTVTLRKTVDDATWRGWSARKDFAMTDEELPVGEMVLDVLPLDEALRVADTIRPGSLILTVRTDRSGVPLWTTHVSLLVPKEGGGTVLRHATKIGNGGTKDHDFRWYLEHLKTYRWPVAGIAVMEPVEQGPRMAAMAR